MNKKVAYKIGFWAALLAVLEVAVFGLLLTINLWVNSPLLNQLSYFVCFLLAPTFITLMTAVYYYAPEQKKIWGHLGILFSVVYAVMVLIVYYLQLVVVSTNSLQASSEIIKPFVYTPGTPVFAIDILGYGFMALATLFAAFVFGGSKIQDWIKGLFIFHGFIGITSWVVPAFLAVETSAKSNDIFGAIALIFWSIIFIPAVVLLAILFRNPQKVQEQ